MKSSVNPLRPDFALEDRVNGPACGLDEAGRGPLAGPVVAACVYVPPAARDAPFWAHVTDSKKLSAKKREDLYGLIRATTVHGIAEASVEEIDSINILRASLLAMKRAYEEVIAKHGEPLTALVDGNQKPPLSCPVITVVRGDSTSLSIAAASILAKVTRDRIMADLCGKFPFYGWSRNAGYGTAQHMEAIAAHGITPHHRRSFAPVTKAISG